MMMVHVHVPVTCIGCYCMCLCTCRKLATHWVGIKKIYYDGIVLLSKQPNQFFHYQNTCIAS